MLSNQAILEGEELQAACGSLKAPQTDRQSAAL